MSQSERILEAFVGVVRAIAKAAREKGVPRGEVEALVAKEILEISVEIVRAIATVAQENGVSRDELEAVLVREIRRTPNSV